jgi:hypothetical protein
MNWWLTVPSWIVALYFGIGFTAKAGFPPKANLLIGDALFVGLTLFFLFLPFFSKIKIWALLELEREIEAAKDENTAVKEELREFKNEVRHTVSVISTNAISQQINVHLRVKPAFALRSSGQCSGFQRMTAAFERAESERHVQVIRQLGFLVPIDKRCEAARLYRAKLEQTSRDMGLCDVLERTLPALQTIFLEALAALEWKQIGP